MMRYVWPLAVFVALLGLLGIGLRGPSQELPSPLIGRRAPAFELARLESPEQRFGPQSMQGRVWLLNVWASWCAACRQEHPVLLDLSSRAGVPIVGLDYKDDARQGRQWLDRYGNPYATVAFDAEGRVGIDYGVYGVPETFVIDRDGVVRHKHTGPLTREVVEGTLLPLIRRLNDA